MVSPNVAGSSSNALEFNPSDGATLLLVKVTGGSKNPHPALSSPPKTFANVFIAIVGAGVLGLPYAFMRMGWVMSLLLLSFIALLTCYCMMLLVKTKRRLDAGVEYSSIGSFGDLGFAVCGSPGRVVVDFLIVLSQVGFCIGYLIFIGNTVANLMNGDGSAVRGLHVYLRGGVEILGVSAKSLVIWVCVPFQLGLNSIKTLTHLAPISIFADVVDLGAMGVVMVEDVIKMMRNRVDLVAFGGLSMFFYGMGVAVYAFEGVGMVIPLEAEMKDKTKFGKILSISMAFIFLMYGGFGLLGYFAFGENTKDIITANFGEGLISTLVQLGLCINLFFTFPLMMNPVYEIFERRFCGGQYCLWLRWSLVVLVTLVALLVPNFADFLSLVGSSVCCALGFILPAAFHLLVFKGEMGRSGWIVDSGIIALGMIFAVSGTWYSLMEILKITV
ncbi:hypothetical protein MLD38_000077 [Melastoma candidum]|uniref:Uncharacterized protein n=1 Tax=Melastoma candidum TaxID=119954 RepID=A0ACB9S8H8_9MYRT|nr:hypothetical protein MLD38_000077 [Melastoma candidum]